MSLNVIDQHIYKYLFELYEDRNCVFHRFIVSEITLTEVEQIAYNYYFLLKEIAIIVDNLESEQISLNVGMTTTDEIDPGNRSPSLDNILGKIGTVSDFESNES